MKSGTLALTGPSGVTNFTSTVIVDNVKKTGDSTIVLNFDAAWTYPGLLGTPQQIVGLVE